MATGVTANTSEELLVAVEEANFETTPLSEDVVSDTSSTPTTTANKVPRVCPATPKKPSRKRHHDNHGNSESSPLDLQRLRDVCAKIRRLDTTQLKALSHEYTPIGQVEPGTVMVTTAIGEKMGHTVRWHYFIVRIELRIESWLLIDTSRIDPVNFRASWCIWA